MKKTLMKVACAFAVSVGTVAAQTARVPVAPDSKLWIDGTSNLHGWSCKATTLDAAIEVDAAVGQIGIAANAVKRVEVKVPVRSMKCGHDAMDNNLYKALKADDDASISYILADFEATPELRDGFTLHTNGTLSLAGKEKPLSMDVSATRLPDGAVKATGTVTVKMTDFGISPPTAMFGTLRTGDEVKVSFDLTVGSKAIATATAGASNP